MLYSKNGEISTCRVLTVNGKTVMNPKKELILANGWEEYTPPTYEPSEDELLLDRHKEVLKLLASTDNEVVRHSEGDPSSTWPNYEELKDQRKEWRLELNQIEVTLGVKWNSSTELYEPIN